MTSPSDILAEPAAARVLAVLTGRVAPLGAVGVPSGMAKAPRSGAVRLGRNGLEGDEQADHRHHGGPEKAVLLYAAHHYDAWCRELAEVESARPVLAAAGAFGENLLVAGLDEGTVCLGDVWSAGTALLEVSQFRQPCWKLNHRFGLRGMSRRVQESGRTGWYARVRQAGELAAGQELLLMARPLPDWPLARLWRLLYRDRLDMAELEQALRLEAIPAGWRETLRRRRDSGRIETWQARLRGPDAAAPGRPG